jgi:hypothetical protein
MFIIVEGTDASGKSTLVTEIQRQLETLFPRKSIEFYHKSKPEQMTRRWVLEDYVTSIESKDWQNCVAVADRWHWGEVTYAPLKRPESDSDGYGLLGVAGWRWVELFLKSRGVSQFWLYQPLAVIKERLSSRGDDYVNADELEKILELYQFASQNCANLVDIVQPEPDSLHRIPDLAKSIIDMAYYEKELAEPLSKFPYYIGSRYPDVLLVGDRRNITSRYGEETILPFMPVDGNSGDFLLSALPSPMWKNVGLININENSSVNVDLLWNTLGRPPIVALGRLAEKGLKAHAFDEDTYVVLPHPQHVRRFFNSRKIDYGLALHSQAIKQDRSDTWILR